MNTLPQLPPTRTSLKPQHWISLFYLSCSTTLLSALPQIENPDFDDSISQSYQINAAHAGNGWYSSNDNSWSKTTIQSETVSLRDPSITGQITNRKSLLQVIQDNQSSTGARGLRLDLIATDTGVSNELLVEIYGLNSFSTSFTTGGNHIDELNAVLLGSLYSHIGGETIDQTSYYLPVDFDIGYNYIVIKVTASLSNANSFVAVDNFEFVAPGESGERNFPFPHAVDYPFGGKPTAYNQVAMNKHVQERWDSFRLDFVTESGTTYNGEWRVDRQDPKNTTASESIGYGMLMCVLMDNEVNDTRPIFDGLLAFYNERLNSHGLMKWEIEPNEDPALIPNRNDAADGDQDVAMALLFADKQWGSDQIPYLDQAKILIRRLENKVAKANAYDLFQSGSFADGDSWQNISYYAPAWYKAFATATNSSYWTSHVVPACYDEFDYFYNNNDASAQGIVPNWHQPSNREEVTEGPGADDTNSYTHGYDACRVGWRLGMDYLWNGTSQSTLAYSNNYALADLMNTITNGDPTKIRTYNVPDGSQALGYNKLTFTAPVGVAAMVSETLKPWRNQIYTSLVTDYQSEDAYFARSLQLLSLLTLTGNFPNMTEVNPSLLINGGFEDGTSSWTLPSNGSSVSYNKNSGLACAQILANGQASAISQIVSVNADTVYELSGYLKTVNLDSGQTAELQVEWRDGSNNLINAVLIGSISANKNHTFVKSIETSPLNAVFAKIELILSGGTNGKAFFDDIRIRSL